MQVVEHTRPRRDHGLAVISHSPLRACRLWGPKLWYGIRVEFQADRHFDRSVFFAKPPEMEQGTSMLPST